MGSDNCLHCMFFNAVDRHWSGRCQRTSPPWATVNTEDWCGEFRPIIKLGNLTHVDVGDLRGDFSAVVVVGNPTHKDGVFTIEWVDGDTVRLTRKDGMTAEQFSDFIKKYVAEVMEEARKLGLKK